MKVHSSMSRMLLVALLAALLPQAVQAQIYDLVQRIDQSKRDGAEEIVVQMREPIRLVAHTPERSGQSLSVFFALINPAATRLEIRPWQEQAQLDASAVYSMARVDGEAGNATLSIDFTKSTAFDVRTGSDGMSIIVRVISSGDPESPVSQTSVTESSEISTTPRQESRLEEARRMLIEGNVDRAIAILESVVAAEGPFGDGVALEMLGLAYERKGHTAKAVAAYRRYLDQRTEESDARTRVQQRLDAIIGVDTLVADDGKKKTRSRRRGNTGEWTLRGGLTQYYRRAEIDIERSGSKYFYTSDAFTAQNDFLSQADIIARRNGEVYDIEARFSGGYRFDMVDDENGRNSHQDDILLSEASVEITHRESDIQLELGRQYHSGDGVLGRFDGLRLAVPLAEDWRLNAYGGRPVDLTRKTSVDESDRYFGALSVDYIPLESDWEATLFTAYQDIDGIADREAVGGEFRFTGESTSLYTLLDYDYGFGEINTVMVLGTYRTPAGTTFSTNIDYRMSPLLTTRNALIGQPVDSIDGLLKLYSESEIRDMAEDRTADSHYVTVNILHPFSDDWQIYAALSEFEYGSTQTSGGVEGYGSTGPEYGYEMQLIGSNLLFENDSHIFSLRHYDGSTTKRSALGAQARYIIGRNWRFQPRLWLEYRESQRDGSDQWALRPSFRVLYNPLRKHHLEFEFGRDWSIRDIPVYGEEEFKNNFIFLSYRYDIY